MPRKSPYSYFEHSKEEFYHVLSDADGTKIKSSRERCSNILDLPWDIRVKIWKYVDRSTRPRLRLVCYKIKYDLDHNVGLSIEIDNVEDSLNKEKWCHTVGIKHLVIENLTKGFDTVDFLEHPDLLTDFKICGNITPSYLNYFMENCENIVELSVDMEKLLLSGKTFFITLDENSFEKLRYIKYKGFSKRDKDLLCLYNNLKGLLEETIPKARIYTIHIAICHKFRSKELRKFHETIGKFVFRNTKWLQYLHLSIRDSYHQLTMEPLVNDKTEMFPLTSTTIHKIENNEKVVTPATPKVTPVTRPKIGPHPGTNKYRGSVHPLSALSETPLIPIEAVDSTSSSEDDSSDSEEELVHISWEPLPRLDKIHITINDHYYPLWKKVIDNCMIRLDTLFLDVHTYTHSTNSNWNLYREAAFKNRFSLTKVILMDIVLKSVNGKSIDLDLGVFNKCVKLQRLSLVGRRHETDSLSKLINVTKLPKSLQILDISYFIVTAWQLFRLGCCFGKLTNLAISYCSKTNEQFGKYVSILRYLTVYKFTPVKKFIIIDAKIRFQVNCKSINLLKHSVGTNATCDDFDENRLTLKTHQVIENKNKIDNKGRP